MDTILSGGFQSVADGGVATGTTVLQDGLQLVGDDEGLVVLNTAITAGTQVSSGGTEVALGLFSQSNTFVYEIGGEVYETVVVSGGTQFVSAGTALGNDVGLVTSFVQSGAEVYTYSSFNGAPVGDVYSQTGYINQSTYVSNTTVLSGGTFIFAGARVVDLVVSSGGTEIIGGPISIDGGAFTITPALVQVSGNHVSSGVLEIVALGGQDLGGVIQVGAEEHIQSGGLASGTDVFYGAKQVLFGGSAVDTTVSSGGSQVLSGGTATTTTLLGGTQTIEAGAIAVGSLLSAATQIVTSGGVVSGSMLFLSSF